MELESILLGFALGLSSTIFAVRLQRSWQKYENRRFNKKILNSLVIEIENGLVRSKNLASMIRKGEGSFGRIYTALWDSVSQRLAGSLEDPEVLLGVAGTRDVFPDVPHNGRWSRPRPQCAAHWAKLYALRMARLKSICA
jgi:hypothetical protein